MNSEQQARLQNEVDLGQRAQHVFDIYLDDFFHRLEAKLYERFLVCPPDQAELLSLKQLTMALAVLKENVLSDIDGGKVALKQLSEATKH